MGRLAFMMVGRTADELAMGTATSGAKNDFE